MQKRVAIARAVVMNPKYLFCDEPNSGLDPKTSTLIDNLIQEITKEYQITTIINTHDMNSVMEIGEKVLFLEDGRKAGKDPIEKSLKLRTKVSEILSIPPTYLKKSEKCIRRKINLPFD